MGASQSSRPDREPSRKCSDRLDHRIVEHPPTVQKPGSDKEGRVQAESGKNGGCDGRVVGVAVVEGDRQGARWQPPVLIPCTPSTRGMTLKVPLTQRIVRSNSAAHGSLEAVVRLAKDRGRSARRRLRDAGVSKTNKGRGDAHASAGSSSASRKLCRAFCARL